MSRHFPGTAEELDSDLLMVWHFLKQHSNEEGPFAVNCHNLMNDLRKGHEKRRRDGAIPPPVQWIREEGLWMADGYPVAIRFNYREFSPWEVHTELPSGRFLNKIASFDDEREAKAFVQKRCNDIDRFEEGP
jgi:hypothetical protein